MKKIFLFLMIALIPFTGISAKRLRYLFNEVKLTHNQRVTVRSGIYRIELNTDNNTVKIQIKPTGKEQTTSVCRITDIDKGSGNYVESACYSLDDGTMLVVSFNTQKKYSTLTLEMPRSNAVLNFGRPYKVEKF